MSPDSDLLTQSFRRQLQTKLETLRASAGYRAYERVRDHVLAIKDLEAHRESAETPSAYWREELEDFSYMFDASPLIIDQLRHHTSHITGLRKYDYRSDHHTRHRFAKKLDALVEAAKGRDLLIPENPALGGFGHEIDGRMFNLDTLKYFEVLMVLQDGAVLPEFRGQTDRRLVWEIGAGWG